MRYGVKMGSGAMICLPASMKMGPGIQALMGGGTHRHTDNIVISLNYFYLYLLRKAGYNVSKIVRWEISLKAPT
jgi:hypothetical protein